jgi:hypothetical protein
LHTICICCPDDFRPLLEKHYHKTVLIIPHRNRCRSDYTLLATHSFPTTPHLVFEHRCIKYGVEKAALALLDINGFVTILWLNRLSSGGADKLVCDVQ